MLREPSKNIQSETFEWINMLIWEFENVKVGIMDISRHRAGTTQNV